MDNLVETTVLLHEFDQLPPQRQADLPIREYQDPLTGLVAEAATDTRLKLAPAPVRARRKSTNSAT